MSETKKEPQKKDLDKMTVKELREIALEMPEITGAHGKTKAELLNAIKEGKGIVDTPVPEPAVSKKKPKKAVLSVADIKKKIRAVRAKRQAALDANDAKMAKIFRRRLSRLKKSSRSAA